MKTIADYQNDFKRTFLAYGGSHTQEGKDEVRRIAFCNWLLVENLEEYPRRAEFVAAFSNNGNRMERDREATYLAQSPLIENGDLADALFWACTDPDGLVDYAGADGIR